MNELDLISGTALATTQDPKDTIASYLLQLRKMLEDDATLSAFVSSCDPAALAADRLIKSCQFEKPDTAHLLEEAVGILLEELETQRKNPGLYLVDCDTGRATMTLGPRDVFTPPDFVGLNGKMQKSSPVVHPSITSGMAIRAYEHEKTVALTEKLGKELAFAHMLDHEQMLEIAKEKLEGAVVFGHIEGAEWESIEFGRENVAGLEQSANLAFHRVELFSSVLAAKIVGKCGLGGRCETGHVASHQNTRQRWYTVPVRVEAACDHIPTANEHLCEN